MKEGGAGITVGSNYAFLSCCEATGWLFKAEDARM